MRVLPFHQLVGQRGLYNGFSIGKFPRPFCGLRTAAEKQSCRQPKPPTAGLPNDVHLLDDVTPAGCLQWVENQPSVDVRKELRIQLVVATHAGALLADADCVGKAVANAAPAAKAAIALAAR